MKKLLAILNLIRRGHAVADPALLGNRAALANAIAGLLAAIIAVVAAFGYWPAELDLGDEVLQSVAVGLAAVVCLINGWMHAASHKDAGLPAKAGPGDVPPPNDSGGSHTYEPPFHYLP